MELNHPKYKTTIKDFILVGAFIVLIITNVIRHIHANNLTNLEAVISQTIILMLAFVGLIEIAYYIGWVILVPDFFRLEKEKRMKKETNIFLNKFFENDINFLHNYNEDKINYILTQLGISRNQLDKIRIDIIKMRCIGLDSIDCAKAKINSLVKCDYPIIINTKNYDTAKLAYKKVGYFINLTDAMFLQDYARELTALLSFLITEDAELLSKVDRIVIPHDSNFLLGVAIGKELKKPIVKMRLHEGKIFKEQWWEGHLKATDSVIIIHDVLVTAEQVVDAKRKLPATCTVLGFYCLIVRKEYDGVKTLEDKGIPVHRIADISDDDIRILRGE